MQAATAFTRQPHDALDKAGGPMNFKNRRGDLQNADGISVLTTPNSAVSNR
jgi:hypothetical protein